MGDGLHLPSVWQLTRAAGVFAYLCLWLSVFTGLLVSTRLLRHGASLSLLAHVHQWASAWAFYGTAVHLAILVFDPWQPFSLAALLAPFFSPYRPAAVAAGVIAFYLMAGAQFSSYLRRRCPPAVWRAIHLLTLPAFILALAHGLAAGSDARSAWLTALYGATGSLFAFALAARLLLGGKQKAVQRAGYADSATEPTANET